MKKNKNFKIRIGLICFLSIFLIIACDMRLKTVSYQIYSDKINAKVNVTLVTDLHGEKYGKEQKHLTEAIAKTNPDVVLLGGDLFDDNRSYENTEKLLAELSASYPCFYVPGNHEYWSKDIKNILSIVESYQIPILKGSNCIIECNGQRINLCGIDDPDALTYTSDSVSPLTQLKTLESTLNNETFSILLSHRPELVQQYQQYPFDLVLCGHAHGGQWRIPGILNGFYAPNQGLFPSYAGGQYQSGTQTMIVSRGLSRITTAVPRIFNRPELVVIEVLPASNG